MPRQLIFEIDGIDLNGLVHDQQAIRQFNPQRGDMEMLSGIIWADSERHCIIGYKDFTLNDFWVSGHIPGRPLLPGVMMIEAAAQLASFYAGKYLNWGGFVGFGGVEECRFRQAVEPPCRLIVMGKQLWHRHGRICCQEQGHINGDIVFETTIIGVKM